MMLFGDYIGWEGLQRLDLWRELFPPEEPISSLNILSC